MDPQAIRTAERLLGREFKDKDLLARSLTHASLVDSRLQSNERLEFLGDAVLGMVVCEYLFSNYPELLEGEMTKIKSSVVSRRTCAEVAIEGELDSLMFLGKGMSTRADLPKSVVAAVFESIIGAIFIDAGLDTAREFILSRMRARIEHAARCGHQFNFKSVLQQSAQQHFDLTPQYAVLDEQGPDHAKCFEVAVEIGGRRFSSCWGPSKKQAEQQAALEALLELGLAERGGGGEIRLCRPDETQPIPPSPAPTTA
jgi:ribonuclease-3